MASWQDNNNDHAKLKEYALDNGLLVRHIYKKLIELYLSNPKIIE